MTTPDRTEETAAIRRLGQAATRNHDKTTGNAAIVRTVRLAQLLGVVPSEFLSKDVSRMLCLDGVENIPD